MKTKTFTKLARLFVTLAVVAAYAYMIIEIIVR
jgi:hypothetical protein